MNHPPTATPKPQWALLVLVLVIASAARLLYLFHAAALPNFTVPYAGLDVELYRSLAGQVAAGQLAIDGLPYYYCAPYAYWLGVLYALFGDGPWVAPIANLVIGLGTVALIYSLTLRLFGSRGAALFAALGATLYGPYLVFDTSGMKTSLGLFLAAGGFWLFLRALDRPLGRNWLIAGVVLALASWFAQILLLVLVLLLLWLLSGRLGAGVVGDLRHRAAAVLLLLAGVVLLYSPFLLHNLLITGEPIPLTATGGIHAYIGNHSGASGAYSKVSGVRNNPMGHIKDAKQVAEKAVGRDLGWREASAHWRRQALRFIAEAPEDARALFARKALLALNADELPNNENYAYLAQRSPLLRVALDASWLLPLGLAGLALGLRGVGIRMPLYLLFFGLLLGLTLTLVTWRYRLPLTLALWPAAGYALARGAYWIKEKRWLAVGGLLVLVLGGLVLSQLPLIPMEQRAEQLRAAEIKMQASAQERRFRRELADGALSGDETIDGWLGIARARKGQNDWEGALRVLREAEMASGRDPRLLGAQVSLLRLLGDHEGAIAVQREVSLLGVRPARRRMGPDGEIRMVPSPPPRRAAPPRESPGPGS